MQKGSRKGLRLQKEKVAKRKGCKEKGLQKEMLEMGVRDKVRIENRGGENEEDENRGVKIERELE